MPLRNLWSEFKAFAFKGNMIDLAVAVVIGAAFSGVINSLVKDVIMPCVSYVTTAAASAKNAAVDATATATSKVGLTTQPSATQPTTEVASGQQPTTTPTDSKKDLDQKKDSPPADEKPVDIDWKIGRIQIGRFVAELLNFVIIAFAVFIIIVKLLGSVMKKVGGTPAPSEPTTKECPECLSIIPIKAKRCAHCTAVLPAVNL